MICIYNICIYIDKLNFREIVQKYSTSYEQGPSFNLWHPKNLNKTKKKKKEYGLQTGTLQAIILVIRRQDGLNFKSFHSLSSMPT